MATQNTFNTNPSFADYAAVLSPTMFNIAQSFTKPDKFNYVSPSSLYSSNKNASAALNILNNRRYDPTQALYRNMQNANIAKYNARNLNTNSGANQAYDIMMATNRMGQDADILDKTSQINNQYQGDYANALMQSGAQESAQESQAKQMANQYNAQQNLYNLQSKAAKSGMLGTGLSQLSNFIQTGMRDKKQEYMDKIRSAIMLESLRQQGLLKGDNSSFSDMLSNYFGYQAPDYTNLVLPNDISTFNSTISNPTYSTPLPSNLAKMYVK